MNPNARANELVEISDRLSDVLERETALLGERRLDAVGALQGEKTNLAQLYEARLREAKIYESAIKATEPKLLEALKAAGARYVEAARQNINALRAAMEMNRRILDTVASAVQSQHAPVSGYTKSGMRAPAGAAYGGTLTPVALNRQF